MHLGQSSPRIEIAWIAVVIQEAKPRDFLLCIYAESASGIYAELKRHVHKMGHFNFISEVVASEIFSLS